MKLLFARSNQRLSALYASENFTSFVPFFCDFLLTMTWCCPPSPDWFGLKVKILQDGLVKPPEAVSLQGTQYLHLKGASPLYSVLWSFKILTALEMHCSPWQTGLRSYHSPVQGVSENKAPPAQGTKGGDPSTAVEEERWTERGCPAPDRHRVRGWPCCPASRQNHMCICIQFAEILISPTSCWYQQGLQALGYWKIRAVSPACAPRPVYERGSAS